MYLWLASTIIEKPIMINHWTKDDIITNIAVTALSPSDRPNKISPINVPKIATIDDITIIAIEILDV